MPTRYRIKNWERFQHYKQRTPPWIKVYRTLLDDMDFYALSGDATKTLLQLWLIASETDGILPDIEQLAFRLRIDSKTLASHINELKNYVVTADASAMLATSERGACLEKEIEKEIEKDPGNTRASAQEYPEFSKLIADSWLLPGNAPLAMIVGKLKGAGVSDEDAARGYQFYIDNPSERRYFNLARTAFIHETIIALCAKSDLPPFPTATTETEESEGKNYGLFD